MAKVYVGNLDERVEDRDLEAGACQGNGGDQGFTAPTRQGWRVYVNMCMRRVYL
jgi:hypothetical protein